MKDRGGESKVAFVCFWVSLVRIDIRQLYGFEGTRGKLTVKERHADSGEPSM